MIIMVKNFKKIFSVILLVIVATCASGCVSNTIEMFYDSLNIPTRLTEDLELKDSYQYKNQTITVVWVTTNADVITTTGIITRTNVDQDAILTANATLGNTTVKRNFAVVVVADLTDIILKEAPKRVLLFPSVSASLSLPDKITVDGAEVSVIWSSSKPEIMDNTGAVTLPKKDTVVELTATFTYNGSSLNHTYTTTVTKDPDYNIGNDYSIATTYTGTIENEIAPARQTEFAGAIYRKVTSSKDYWLGIEVVVTLPEFIPDEGRTGVNPYGGETDMRYLDNASVYLGANAGFENDAGLSWSLGIDTNGKVDYSKSVAFRPFWRYIVPGDNIYNNASVNDTQFYYYPGDKVRMSVYVSKDNYMQLRIELLEETTIEKYVAFRASYNLGDDYEKVFISPEYSSGGAGISKTLFKRVCALDQVNNEGKPTQLTNAKSLNTIWHECYLYREINGVVVKVPMIDSRASKLSSPSGSNSLGDFSQAFMITTDGVNPSLGGEVVSINPNNRR